ncbi:nicotinate-nucleotide adenylyltransferase [Paenibacillus sp. GXUN7292]|uniref:nicotinate-nucleotide adenylyltransferase n=1 Tax=Paenibacillus sp. GXUN7292 TaxID=3422499 RepID=UPI003D7D9BB2
MKAIGIMGGAFDPIHIGHLIAAESAREACKLDEVWFIPTFGSPLKANRPGAEGHHRLAMVEAAISGNSAFRAIDMELARGGTSYSIDTAAELLRQYPAYSFSYIIGSDRINDLPQWHRVEELAAIVSFIGLERPSDAPRLEQLSPRLKERLQMVQMPAIGLSSTALRDKLSAGQSVRYEIPAEVEAYIRRHDLYGSVAAD